MAVIAEYITADNPRAAIRVIEYIRAAATLLETSPLLGLESSEAGVRELILARYPYILVYEVTDADVRIFAVFHHHQQRK